jgi:hypothetical protein
MTLNLNAKWKDLFSQIWLLRSRQKFCYIYVIIEDLTSWNEIYNKSCWFPYKMKESIIVSEIRYKYFRVWDHRLEKNWYEQLTQIKPCWATRLAVIYKPVGHRNLRHQRRSSEYASGGLLYDSTGSRIYIDDGRAGAHKSGTCNLFMAFCELEWVDLHVALAPGFRLILWNKNCNLQKYSMSDLFLRF